MNKRTISMQFVAPLLAGVCICFCHSKLNEALDRQMGNSAQLPALIPSYQAVRLISLGFDQVIADYYWLAFIGYIGDTENRKKDRYAQASKYLELITALDPSFVQAYWFAAFTVGGDLHRPKQAAQIIEKGIEANPDNWYLPLIGGLNQYLYAGDQVAAAKYYRQASKYPGSPDWLERHATILETDAPRLVKEAYSWLNIYDSAEEERVKEHARERSIWLWVQVYKNAPTEAFRKQAKVCLSQLGVDIDDLVSKLRQSQ